MIKHLLLDIDNTLYPASSLMNTGVYTRIIRFVAAFLGLSDEEAAKIRRESVNRPDGRYGTTIEWLRNDFHIEDVNAYFSFVHPESEVQELIPDDNLRPFLQSLDMPMTILTNSPLVHAERVLSFFHVEDLFPNVFDITRNAFLGKPHKKAYLNALAESGFSIEETLFVDDSPRYVVGYQALGGQGVLVNATGDKQGLTKGEVIASIYDITRVLS
jgi:putative hydrolase of the HAD superfamily